MKSEAVIFDLDGVLVDSEGMSAVAWQAPLAKYGISLPLEWLLVHPLGKTFEATIKLIEEYVDWKAPEGFIKEVSDHFDTAFYEVPPMEGAVQTLSALRENKIPFAVASNSELGRLKIKLKAAGLQELVGEHFYNPSFVGGRAKPLPDVYLFAAKQIGFKIEQCIIIEDSPVGICGAAGTGAVVWALQPEPYGNLPENVRLFASHLELGREIIKAIRAD